MDFSYLLVCVATLTVTGVLGDVAPLAHSAYVHTVPYNVPPHAARIDYVNKGLSLPHPILAGPGFAPFVAPPPGYLAAPGLPLPAAPGYPLPAALSAFNPYLAPFGAAPYPGLGYPGGFFPYPYLGK